METTGSKPQEVKTLKLKLNNRFEAGREGFEPSTSSLEGWRSIRAELTTHVEDRKGLSCFKPYYEQNVDCDSGLGFPVGYSFFA